MRFVLGHGGGGKRERNPNWKGGVRRSRGYVLVKSPGHPRADATWGYVPEHVLIAETALGKPLPDGAEVHHLNGIKDDNRPENLIICPDRAYHFLLHQRQRSLEACGHADWRKCVFCKEYDDPANLTYSPASRSNYHAACTRAYQAERKRRRRTA